MKYLPLLMLISLLSACTQSLIEDHGYPGALRFNEIQMIGSHNSYKLPIDVDLLDQIRMNSNPLANSLEYSHQSLTTQLDLGIRKFELDLYLDPDGGLFSDPLGLKMISAPAAYNSDEMKLPGLKVMHVQDIDFRSHCQLFRTCLEILLKWSVLHPDHMPIVILINAKDDAIDQPGFVRPLKFDQQSWDVVDSEIRSSLEPRLFTPDQLRGENASLPDAVKVGWPLLSKLRGKFLFVLDQEGEKRAGYIAGHAALKGRAMFVNALEGTPEAAIRIINDPIADFDKIRSLVRSGYIVRTRADADTVEARSGATVRRDKAFASGAQIISTDYYLDDPRFEPHYQVTFTDDVIAVCNPVLLEQECQLGNP